MGWGARGAQARCKDLTKDVHARFTLLRTEKLRAEAEKEKAKEAAAKAAQAKYLGDASTSGSADLDPAVLLANAKDRKEVKALGWRVAVRAQPREDGFVEGTRGEGEVLETCGLSDDGNWVRLGDKQWVMISHPTLGTLLEKLPESDE